MSILTYLLLTKLASMASHQHIFAKDESITMAKNDTTNAQKMAINSAHAATVKPVVSILHQGRDIRYSLSTAFKQAIKFNKELGYGGVQGYQEGHSSKVPGRTCP